MKVKVEKVKAGEIRAKTRILTNYFNLSNNLQHISSFSSSSRKRIPALLFSCRNSDISLSSNTVISKFLLM